MVRDRTDVNPVRRKQRHTVFRRIHDFSAAVYCNTLAARIIIYSKLLML